jgi:hypothetical protein
MSEQPPQMALSVAVLEPSRCDCANCKSVLGLRIRIENGADAYAYLPLAAAEAVAMAILQQLRTRGVTQVH